MGDWHRRVFGLGVNERQPVFWGGSRDAGSSLRAEPERWHFLAVVYDPPWLTFWVDGESERVPAPELATVYSGGLWLGLDTVNDGADFRRLFQGVVDEVWIYSRALPADELAGLREGE